MLRKSPPPRQFADKDIRLSKLELMTTFYDDEFRNFPKNLQDGVNGLGDKYMRTVWPPPSFVPVRVSSYSYPATLPPSGYLLYKVHETTEDYKSKLAGTFMVALGRCYK